MSDPTALETSPQTGKLDVPFQQAVASNALISSERQRFACCLSSCRCRYLAPRCAPRHSLSLTLQMRRSEQFSSTKSLAATSVNKNQVPIYVALITAGGALLTALIGALWTGERKATQDQRSTESKVEATIVPRKGEKANNFVSDPSSTTFPQNEPGRTLNRPHTTDFLSTFSEVQLLREIEAALSQSDYERALAAIKYLRDPSARDRERGRILVKVTRAHELDLARKIVIDIEDARLKENALRDLSLELIKR